MTRSAPPELPRPSDLDPDSLRRRIRALSSWEEWSVLEEEVFRLSAWPEASLEEQEELLDRPPLEISGEDWFPLANPYAVPGALQAFHEWARWEAFAHLEPEAEAENQDRPEGYGAACYPCQRYRRRLGPPAESCPRCGAGLVRISLGS